MRKQKKGLLAIVFSGLLSVCCAFAGVVAMQMLPVKTAKAETVTAGTIDDSLTMASTKVAYLEDTFLVNSNSRWQTPYNQLGTTTPVPFNNTVTTAHSTGWQDNAYVRFGLQLQDNTADADEMFDMGFGSNDKWMEQHIVRLDYTNSKVMVLSNWYRRGSIPVNVPFTFTLGKVYLVEMANIYLTDSTSTDVGERVVFRLYENDYTAQNMLLDIQQDFTADYGTTSATTPGDAKLCERGTYFYFNTGWSGLASGALYSVKDYYAAEMGEAKDIAQYWTDKNTCDKVKEEGKDTLLHGSRYGVEWSKNVAHRFALTAHTDPGRGYVVAAGGNSDWNVYSFRLDYANDCIYVYKDAHTEWANQCGLPVAYTLDLDKTYYIEIATVEVYATAAKDGGVVADRVDFTISDGTNSLSLSQLFIGTQMNLTDGIFWGVWAVSADGNSGEATSSYTISSTITGYTPVDEDNNVEDISKSLKMGTNGLVFTPDKTNAYADIISGRQAWDKDGTKRFLWNVGGYTNEALGYRFSFGGSDLWSNFAAIIPAETGNWTIKLAPTANLSGAVETSVAMQYDTDYIVEFSRYQIKAVESVFDFSHIKPAETDTFVGVRILNAADNTVVAEVQRIYADGALTSGMYFGVYVESKIADMSVKAVDWHAHIKVDGETVVGTPEKLAEGLAAKTQEGKVFVGYQNGGKLYKAATAMDEALFVNDATFTSVFVDYDMGFGAYLRTGNKGIRWEATMSDADWNALLALDATATRGMGVKRLSDNAGTFIQAQRTYVKEEGVTGFVCSVTDIVDVSVEYEARAYIEVQYANASERSKVYAATNDNVRSFASMAETALELHNEGTKVLPADVVEFLQSVVGGM